MRQRAETGHQRIKDLEDQATQAKALGGAFQRQLTEERTRFHKEREALEAEQRRAADRVETLETRSRQLQDALDAAEEQMHAGEQAMQKARAHFSLRSAEMTRHIARLEAALQGDPPPRPPALQTGSHLSQAPPHTMEKRLADRFELEEEPRPQE